MAKAFAAFFIVIFFVAVGGGIVFFVKDKSIGPNSEAADALYQTLQARVDELSAENQDLNAQIKMWTGPEETHQTLVDQMNFLRSDNEDLNEKVQALEATILQWQMAKRSSVNKDMISPESVVSEKQEDPFEEITGMLKEAEKVNAQAVPEAVETVENSPAQITPAKRQGRTFQDDVGDRHYNFGVIKAREHEFEKAIAEFQKALEFIPEDADAHFNLAVLYDEEMNDSEKAVEHYRAYLKHTPQAEDRQKVEKWIIDNIASGMVRE